MSMFSASSGFQKSLEKQFRAGSSYLGFDVNPDSVVLSSKMPLDVALSLYGSYKQVTTGSCDLPEPNSNFEEQRKWRSWKQMRYMSSTEAMLLFLTLLEAEDPEWYSRGSSFTLESVADDTINSKRMETQVLNSEDRMEIILDCKAGLSGLTVRDQWAVAVISYPRAIGRYEHGAALIDDKMYVYGGNHNGELLDDLTIFDLKTWTWSTIIPELVDASYPLPLAPCAGHSLIPWRRKLLSIGGYMEHPRASMQVRMFDLKTFCWSILRAKGEPPVCRGGHSATLVGSDLVIFGGEDVEQSLLNDVHILDLKKMTWERKKPLGEAPSPRSHHVATVHEERYVFIFGGNSGATYCNDLHVLDMKTMEWSRPQQHGNIPKPQVGCAGVSVGDHWYIVGSDNQIRISQTFVLNMSTCVWSELANVHGRVPLASKGLSLVLGSHMGEDILLSFGGYSGWYSSEVNVLKLSRKSTLAPFGAHMSMNASTEIELETRENILDSKLVVNKAEETAEQELHEIEGMRVSICKHELQHVYYVLLERTAGNQGIQSVRDPSGAEQSRTDKLQEIQSVRDTSGAEQSRPDKVQEIQSQEKQKHQGRGSRWYRRMGCFNSSLSAVVE